MNRKEAYIEKAQAKIDEYASKLEQLKAKAKGEVADLKIEALEQIERFEKKLETAKLRLAELTGASENRWQDLSDRFEVLADDLAVSFKKFFEKR